MTAPDNERSTEPVITTRAMTSTGFDLGVVPTSEAPDVTTEQADRIREAAEHLRGKGYGPGVIAGTLGSYFDVDVVPLQAASWLIVGSELDQELDA